jgi:hypothetical protein
MWKSSCLSSWSVTLGDTTLLASGHAYKTFTQVVLSVCPGVANPMEIDAFRQMKCGVALVLVGDVGQSGQATGLKTRGLVFGWSWNWGGWTRQMARERGFRQMPDPPTGA